MSTNPSNLDRTYEKRPNAGRWVRLLFRTWNIWRARTLERKIEVNTKLCELLEKAEERYQDCYYTDQLHAAVCKRVELAAKKKSYDDRADRADRAKAIAGDLAAYDATALAAAEARALDECVREFNRAGDARAHAAYLALSRALAEYHELSRARAIEIVLDLAKTAPPMPATAATFRDSDSFVNSCADNQNT